MLTTNHLSLITAFLFLLPIPYSLLPVPAHAQGIITTVAGTSGSFRGDGGLAIDAPLSVIEAVTADSTGNLFVVDGGYHLLVKISPTGVLNVIAGNGIRSFSGNGGSGTNASLSSPRGVASDASGNLYIADTLNHQIRRVTPDGIITTAAGNGGAGFSGDGGPATNASLYAPSAVAVDADGNLYVADTLNQRIRKVNPDGIITTVAGNGVAGFAGDGGPAIAASLNSPSGIAVDPNGSLYIADLINHRIRKVSPASTITTVAGSGLGGFSGDGGLATSARLQFPRAVAVDAAGNLYIADSFNHRIRRVDQEGSISTVAGNGAAAFFGDGSSANSASLNEPSGLTVDASGNIYVADTFNLRIRRINSSGIIATVAGNGRGRFSGDGGPASAALLFVPASVAVDSPGNLYIADAFNHRIRKVSSDGVITTIAGNGIGGFSGDGGPATAASLSLPHGVAVDPAGNVYIADTGNLRIRKVTTAGIISTLAGNGFFGFSGDGGAATRAMLASPWSAAALSDGTVYIADRFNDRVRKVSPSGTISTVVGNGVSGFSGDGGPAVLASLREPVGVALDASGNLYIADWSDQRIRKVNPGGTISTLAGNGVAGFSGEGGPASSASLNFPQGIAVDALGNVYIAELNGNRIHKVSQGGTITTVAGNAGSGFSGDGGPATTAALLGPAGVAVDGEGNLYIADAGNGRIRKVLVAAPSFSVTPTNLPFSAPAGMAVTAPQQVIVSSRITGLEWRADVSTESGNGWLLVSPAAGSVPGSLGVSVDTTRLAPGTYRGIVTVYIPPANPPIHTVFVTLTVQPPLAAQLSVEPASISFETLAGAGNPPAPTLRIGNAGGGSLDWTARAETTAGGNWLSLSPASGTATAGASNQVQVVANSSTLAAGVYSGAVVVESATTRETLRVPVSLLISQSRQTILVSQSGLLFTGVEGGSLVPPQTFGVLNTGEGVMSWTAQASTLAGGNWLSVSPTNASTDAAALRVPLVNVAVNVAGLTAGAYSGQIRISATGANNSPQFVTVILNVLPAESSPGVLVRPTGMIFAAQAGTSSPGSQTVNLGTVTPGNVDVVSGLLTRDGATWLEAVPRNLTLSAGDAIQRIVVQPTLGSLAPGVYRGALTFLFSDSSPPQVVSILFLVVSGRVGNPSRARQRAGIPADGFASEPRASAGGLDSLGPLPYGRGSDSRGADGCAATQLHATHRTLGTNFASPVGWPSTVEAQVADDCGNAVPNATVVARFSNGDPLVVLTSLRNGLYVGTWRPVNSTGQVTVTVRAELPPLAPVEVQAQGQVSANATVPALSAGGVVNAASFAKGEAVAPGSIVSIFGTKLAVGEGAATRLPLETQLAGTSVTIGGQAIPLLYASEGQVNAVVPYGLAVNTRQQIVVRRGNSYSVPEPVTVAAAQPAVFTKDQTGKGQGLIFVAASGELRLADASSPARAGDAVVIYCSGLGAVNPPVAGGAAAPSSPLSVTANPVSVTIGGREAQVLFAGLAPGFAGLYQVNAIVPPGVSPSNEAPVSLTVAGQTSPPVTLAVR